MRIGYSHGRFSSMRSGSHTYARQVAPRLPARRGSRAGDALSPGFSRRGFAASSTVVARGGIAPGRVATDAVPPSHGVHCLRAVDTVHRNPGARLHVAHSLLCCWPVSSVNRKVSSVAQVQTLLECARGVSVAAWPQVTCPGFRGGVKAREASPRPGRRLKCKVGRTIAGRNGRVCRGRKGYRSCHDEDPNEYTCGPIEFLHMLSL